MSETIHDLELTQKRLNEEYQITLREWELQMEELEGLQNKLTRIHDQSTKVNGRLEKARQAQWAKPKPLAHVHDHF